MKLSTQCALFVSLAAAIALASACSAGKSSISGGTGGAGGTGTTASTSVATIASSATGFMTGVGGSGGAAPTCNPGGPNDDVDGDGFTPAQGDCDDCDPNSNPDAIEVPTVMGETPRDENCDGQIDEVDTVLCDDSLAIDDAEPLDAAKAIDLCKVSTGPKDWGVVDAKWVQADGSAPPADPATLVLYHLGHGMLSKFGANIHTRKGQRMLGLSSGSARDPSDPGYIPNSGAAKSPDGEGFICGQPVGFPKESPACPGVTTGAPHDSAAVELNIRTPSNATGIQFDFDFFTYEWPNFECSEFNDFFIALLTPFPMGQTDGNIVFDAQNNPISVNNALMNVCGCPGNPPSPCIEGGKTFTCSLGDSELIQTGFGFDTESEDHGSTSWLQTTAPVPHASTINLRLAVYDSTDAVLATSTLIDNFKWVATPGTKVGTNPVPN